MGRKCEYRGGILKSLCWREKKRRKKKAREWLVETSLMSRLDLWQLKETLQREEKWLWPQWKQKVSTHFSSHSSLCSHLPALPSFFSPSPLFISPCPKYMQGHLCDFWWRAYSQRPNHFEQHVWPILGSPLSIALECNGRNRWETNLTEVVLYKVIF